MAIDALGNALEHNGRVNYSPKLVKSPCGNFDGVNDYAEFGVDSAFALSEFTIMMHVKTTETANTVLFETNQLDGYTMILAPTSGKFVLASGGTVRNGTISINDGVWHKISFVNSIAEGFKFYVDGVLDISFPYSTPDYTLYAAGRSTQLGARNGAIAMACQVSALKIYDTGLTVTQIQDAGFVGTPVFHAPFEDKKGVTAYDVSGNGNHGVLTNITEATFWSETQDLNHYCISHGLRLPELIDSKIVCIGDSNTFGFGLSDPDTEAYPSLVAEHLFSQPVFVENNGISGVEASTYVNPLGTNYVNKITTPLTGITNKYVILQIGINDIDGIKTPATIFADIEAIYDNLIADGISFIACTIPYVLGNPTTNADVDGINALIKASLKPDYTIDLNDALGLTASYYQTDNVHLTTTGHALWFSLLEPTLSSIDFELNTSAADFGLQIPALADKTVAADGEYITNPSGYWHNGSSTSLQFEKAPELIQADILEGNNILFDSTSNYDAKSLDYAALSNAIGDGDQYFIDESVENKKKNLLIYSNPLSGSDLTKAKKYNNIT